MKAYKFETVIQEEGIIKLPQLKNLVNHKVEIFLVDVTEGKEEESRFKTFADFSGKWKGCLKGANISDYKADRLRYIEEKHK